MKTCKTWLMCIIGNINLMTKLFTQWWLFLLIKVVKKLYKNLRICFIKKKFEVGNRYFKGLLDNGTSFEHVVNSNVEHVESIRNVHVKHVFEHVYKRIDMC